MPRRNRKARQPKAPWFIAKHGNKPPVVKKKRIPPFSLRRHQNAVLYKKSRQDYLRRHARCECCIARGLTPKFATEIHHSRGRVGNLLIDERFFKSACTECHDWIHANIVAARSIGLICPEGQWNTLPR